MVDAEVDEFSHNPAEHLTNKKILNVLPFTLKPPLAHRAGASRPG